MKTRAMIAGLGMLIALPLAAQEMFFYPSQGQTPEQQSEDRSECQVWAQQQTGVDPMRPAAQVAAAPAPARQGGLLRGAARGAAVGAVVVRLRVMPAREPRSGPGPAPCSAACAGATRSVSRRSSRVPRNRSISRRSHRSRPTTIVLSPPVWEAEATAPTDQRAKRSTSPRQATFG
jgi:hypothetical protein